MRWREGWEGGVQRALCIRKRGPQGGGSAACLWGAGVQAGGDTRAALCPSQPGTAVPRPQCVPCRDRMSPGVMAVGKGWGLGALLPPSPPPLAPPLLLVPFLLLLPLLFRLLLGFALLLHCQAQLLQLALEHGAVLRAAHTQSLPAHRALPERAHSPPSPALGSAPPPPFTSPVRGLEASLLGCLKPVLPSAPRSRSLGYVGPAVL